MAPGRSMISISNAQRRSSLASFLLSASCLLLLAAFSSHVGSVAATCDIVETAGAAAISTLDDFGSGGTTGRRLLVAGNGSTQSLREDADVLLEIKKKITADPNNITYWWKRQGKKQALNPCKMQNSTKQYWPGIDCTDKRVTAIDLSGMSLAGTLSPLLGKLSQLKHLNLSDNLFTGPIPTALPPALETLDLGNNLLEFDIPASLGDLRSLISLDVANNRLTGAIPASVGNLQLLAALNMSGNNLTGEIPLGLNSCSRLSMVDLSRNGGIQGVVPFQGLENLTTLRLQGNRLVGNLVVRLDTFPRLVDLDLSNNGMVGSLPTTMSGSLVVQRLDLSGNQFTGSLPDAVGSLSSLRELDVSGNGLSGEIPKTIASLASLETFNASHNGFNGSLPSLAGMQSLRVFDASYNNLTGGIPKDFVDFTTLVALNVSYNNLSGEVPAFVEHDEVNNRSFLQNRALCGRIVGRVCGAGSSSSDPTTKIVSISVGSSVAFAAMAVVMFICCRRRYRGRARSSASVSAELDSKLTPEEVRRATHNFSDRNYVGVGSMSTVYRGVLPDATVVAVKRLGIHAGEVTEGGEKVLDDGLAALAQVRDWTLVKVVGYCCSPEVKAVVLEYMPNGTLSNLMYPPREAEVVREFNWTHRFNAAIAVAQGLKYLHHDCRTPTVHGDLKPKNILFSTFMEARIADFGVKRLLASHGLGLGASLTNGYTAPELAASAQGGTIKGDVYSFGIIVLELISGRSPQSLEAGQRLPQWVRATISNSKSLHNVLDPILMGELRVQQQRMAMVLGVALLCTREDPQERPYISEVLKMLDHIKTRPQDGSRRGSARKLRSSLSTHQRNEEIRHEVPGIEIEPSPPPTPSYMPPLPNNPSLSHWTPNSAVDR